MRFYVEGRCSVKIKRKVFAAGLSLANGAFIKRAVRKNSSGPNSDCLAPRFKLRRSCPNLPPFCQSIYFYNIASLIYAHCFV